MARKLKKRGCRKKSTDRAYQFKICVWLALRKTTMQIKDLLKEQLGVSMSVQNIDHNYRYARKWRSIINYIRTRYLNNISHIPIAQKAYRLLLLDEAALEANIWRTKSVSQWGTVQEKKIGLISGIIREARAEVEGDKPLIEEHLHLTVEKREEIFAKARKAIKAGLF